MNLFKYIYVRPTRARAQSNIANLHKMIPAKKNECAVCIRRKHINKCCDTNVKLSLLKMELYKNWKCNTIAALRAKTLSSLLSFIPFGLYKYSRMRTFNAHKRRKLYITATFTYKSRIYVRYIVLHRIENVFLTICLSFLLVYTLWPKMSLLSHFYVSFYCTNTSYKKKRVYKVLREMCRTDCVHIYVWNWAHLRVNVCTQAYDMRTFYYFVLSYKYPHYLRMCTNTHEWTHVGVFDDTDRQRDATCKKWQFSESECNAVVSNYLNPYVFIMYLYFM